MNAYYPKNQLSTQLLASVPKKIEGWLRNLGSIAENLAQYQKVSWNFDSESGTLIYCGPDDDKIQLWWTGPASSAAFICGNQSWMEDCEVNLSMFVELEKKFYDEIQHLENFIRAVEKEKEKAMSDVQKKNISAFKAARV